MRKIIIGLAVLALNTGCGDEKKPQVELIQDMMQQPSIKAQDYKHYTDGKGSAMKLPPEGAIPQGHTPYTIETSEEAEQKLVNPVELTDEVLAQGQMTYYIYCFVCHGETGAGNGPVASKMLISPPSLLTDRMKNWKDGGFFHLITKGRGLMGSYAAQIPDEEDRWAVVHFIRHLQEQD